VRRLFDRYDAPALTRLFEEVGVLAALRAKGFGGFEVDIAGATLALPHVLLRAQKDGQSHLLLDACLRRIVIGEDQLCEFGLSIAGPLDVLLVQWVREEDPTAAFGRERPPLPLQSHPGLGVLRRAFRIAVRIAADLGVDGVANQPKFFHDAVIFQHSRLFLFLDGREQGRFEALRGDLDALSLRDASLAVAGWCVRDNCDRVVRWEPGYQIFPVSARLTAYFHSARYAADVAAARQASAFRIDAGAFASARAQCHEVGA
jgi:hypothetical protein